MGNQTGKGDGAEQLVPGWTVEAGAGGHRYAHTLTPHLSSLFPSAIGDANNFPHTLPVFSHTCPSSYYVDPETQARTYVNPE